MFDAYDRDTYLKGTGTVLIALFVFNWIPIVNLIRIIPTFKELILGATVVVAFTSAAEWKDGGTYALVVGMIAAVLFNQINIPLRTLFGGVMYGAMGTGSDAGAAGSAAMGGVLSGLAR
jgi:hypothetical protein